MRICNCVRDFKDFVHNSDQFVTQYPLVALTYSIALKSLSILITFSYPLIGGTFVAATAVSIFLSSTYIDTKIYNNIDSILRRILNQAAQSNPYYRGYFAGRIVKNTILNIRAFLSGYFIGFFSFN